MNGLARVALFLALSLAHFALNVATNMARVLSRAEPVYASRVASSVNGTPPQRKAS